MNKEPPLGLMPRFIWYENRLEKVNEAIQRYVDYGVVVPEYFYREKKYLEYTIPLAIDEFRAWNRSVGAKK